MAGHETPLDPRVRQEIFDALAGVETLPKAPTVIDARRLIERERIDRALRERKARQEMHGIKPPSLKESLGCLFLPLGLIVVGITVLKELYRFKSS